MPLLLLDAGGSRARGRRRVQFVLAERGSGFALWKDTLDNLSGYTGQDALFHTLYTSRDHNTRIGLSFDHENAANNFLETGANQRPSTVTYDRADSSISITPADAYDWDAIFADAQWLHLSGITPAISETAAEATIMAAQKAREARST